MRLYRLIERKYISLFWSYHLKYIFFEQFRVPDGRMERKHFSANDTIENILGYASTIMTVAGNQLELAALQMSTVSMTI